MVCCIDPIYGESSLVNSGRMETKIENAYHAEMERLREDLRTLVRDGEELLKSGMSTMRGKAREAADMTDHYMRERPYESMGIVLGLGFLAGVLASALLFSGGRQRGRR